MAPPGRQPTVSDEDILAVFYSSERPVLSTTEVAEEIAIKRRGTFNRLESLAEDGELVQKDLPNRAAVWYPPELLDSWEPSDE